MQADKFTVPNIPSRVNGFTLVEMLVALVVLSVGLLGLASLQANTLKMNDSAYYRTQATYLGYDILERIRANSAAAIAGNYNVALGFTPPTGTNAVSSDLNQWDTLVGSLLPSGQGSIACVAGLCTISIQWDDDRGRLDPASEAQIKTLTLSTQI